MSRTMVKICSLWLAVACLMSFPAGAVTIDMVTVGNPGNTPDTATGNVYGSVAYSYQIGKYDVTIGQYTEFLNAADPNGTNPYGIYNPAMGTDLNIAGITFNTFSKPGEKYSAISNGGDSSNRPITYVSRFDAARFANWMHNGQGSGSTETGAYTLGGATSGDAVTRNVGATFYIPTENEWYKAAYYSPLLNSGSGGYYAYATQSNTAPDNSIGSGANQGNYYSDSNGYSVTQSLVYSPTQNYLTDVGAFSGSGSYYGTFDQSGNAYQWNDLDGTAGSSRAVRGGYWYSIPFGLSSLSRFTIAPSDEFASDGFRLASPMSVPEIDAAGLGSVIALISGGLCLLERRRKRA